MRIILAFWMVLVAAAALPVRASDDCRPVASVFARDADDFMNNVVRFEPVTYAAADARSFRGVRRSQILQAFDAETVEEAFLGTDEREIYRFEFFRRDLAAKKFTVLYSYMGDTRVGGIFEAGTDNLVARLSDGDLLVCDPRYVARRHVLR